MSKRQIVLDTETTGLEPELGHRVIEIGCVELIDRRFTHNNFHYYLNPEREIDAGALEVHGITNEFLLDKPKFSQIKEQLIKYLSGAELIIHNAAFDVGFLDHEFRRAGEKELCIADLCEVIDSLQLARQKHPGQKNSLDALCKRHGIDNSQRTLHGALLDAEILADVYLALTGGQSLLNLEFDSRGAQSADPAENRGARVDPLRLRSVVVSAEDLLAHDQWLSLLGERSLFQ